MKVGVVVWANFWLVLVFYLRSGGALGVVFVLIDFFYLTLISFVQHFILN